MDFLSFLASAMDFVVDLAKILAILATVIFCSPLVKKLPTRVRTALSILTGALFMVAFFRYVMTQHISLLAFRTYIFVYLICAVTTMMFSFMLLIASLQLLHFKWANSKVKIPLIIDDGTNAQKSQKQFISSFYLKASPVMLQ